MKLYPRINSQLPKRPKRLYAIPVLGLFLKILMLLPVGIEISFLFLAFYIASVANSLYVLFTGRFWSPVYNFGFGLLTLFTKSSLFLTGVTDEYPGFKIKSSSLISLEPPKKPNRLFALPLLGGVVRTLLLVPYYIFGTVVSYASYFGALYAVKYVLLERKYPEITYEIILDSTRVNLATSLYFFGFSDSYPSFKISMNHKTEKIVLLILGTLVFIFSNFSSSSK